jgi:hypothetical protein
MTEPTVGAQLLCGRVSLAGDPTASPSELLSALCPARPWARQLPGACSSTARLMLGDRGGRAVERCGSHGGGDSA